MAKIDDFVGKIMHHPYHGEVKVLSRIPKTRVILEIKDIDRGPGYDHDKRKYVGVKTSTGWMRGQNYGHGHIDETHYKHLNKVKL